LISAANFNSPGERTRSLARDGRRASDQHTTNLNRQRLPLKLTASFGARPDLGCSLFAMLSTTRSRLFEISLKPSLDAQFCIGVRRHGLVPRTFDCLTFYSDQKAISVNVENGDCVAIAFPVDAFVKISQISVKRLVVPDGNEELAPFTSSFELLSPLSA
jgi:hypothetical protein